MWQQSSYRDRDLKKNCQYKHWGPESDSRKSRGKRWLNHGKKQETLWRTVVDKTGMSSLTYVLGKERWFRAGSCCVRTPAKEALHGDGGRKRSGGVRSLVWGFTGRVGASGVYSQ